MNYKIQVYVYVCVLLLNETLVNSFSSLDYRRMFRGFCPPLKKCLLREADCHGGYAKDILGCSVCMCARSSTACEGIQCPVGQHCETLNRRAGWFSLRNYKCVSDLLHDPIPRLPILLIPAGQRPEQQTSSSTLSPTTSTTTPTTTVTTQKIKTTDSETIPTTTTTTTKSTTTASTASTTTTSSVVGKTDFPNICPSGAKPGGLCNRDRHCKSDQTCRIYPDLDYGVCCDDEIIKPQNEYRFVPRCKQTQDVGPCRSLVPRYFYNKASGRCEMFIFGGCGNNDNNFKSYYECKQNCENPCQLTMQSGRCRAAMARVYYDTKTNRCNMFYFGGCSNEANGNNWDSFEDCYNHCYDHTRK